MRNAAVGPACDTLDEILIEAWNGLRRGVTDRRHGYHLPTLATIGADGFPSARTVVLRGADEAARTIRCHSDLRSPKVADIQRDSRISWTLYDPGWRVQIRVTGLGEVLTSPDDPFARQAWAQTRLQSRRCYLAPNGPSQRSAAASANLPDDFLLRDPEQDESKAGEANFCVIRCQVQRLEWLRIRHDGHRRAGFSWSADGACDPYWLEP